MARKLKWAVIGSGGIARRRTIPEGFVPANNAHLVSVYGTNAATNKAVAQEFCAVAVDSVDALLATDIEAVYVASPVQAHRDQVLTCAKAGKHVLCEKPLGRTVAEAQEMVDACRKAGVELGVAFMMRFHTQHQAAAKLLHEGKLGKPVYARAQLSCWYPPMRGAFRQDPALGGGGSLIDMGNHCIDLLEMFFGPVQTVSCFTNRTVHSYESEDSAVVLLRFANGALGSVDTFFCIQDESSRNALELYGSKGSILATGTIGQASAGQMTAYLHGQEAGYQAQQTRAAGQGIAITPEPRNIYRAEIEAFGERVIGDRGQRTEHRAQRSDIPLSAELGLHSQKVIAACYESAITARAISVA
ncbi:MAG: hypothetical protein C5B50_22885 [Verrucomicrobia bacterium]|nr:MAG: hypothetical protein C5B50_22885 [Verrucomicrobiota bacterium]